MATPRYSADGLASEWDSTDSVRDRVRGGGFLEDATFGVDSITVKNAVLNMAVAVPLLVRLVAADLQLPPVDALRAEVAELYLKNSREVTDAQIDDSAWFCRKLVVFIKMKAEKKLVSLVPLLKNGKFLRWNLVQ